MLEQDLVTLGIKISKDPETYKDDYLEQLRTLEALLALPAPPLKQISPMIFFVVRHSRIDPDRSLGLLRRSLETITEHKTRRVVLDGLILMRQKGLVESRELVRLIVTYGHELSYFVRSTQEFLDVGCYGVVREWYLKGTERQKKFCYFLMLVIFSKVHEVGERLAEYSEVSGEYSSECELGNESELDNESDSDIANVDNESDNVDSESDSTNKLTAAGIIREETRYNNSNNTVDLSELEGLICDAFFIGGALEKTACLFFLNRTEVRFDISKLRHGAECALRIHRQLTGDVMDRDVKVMKMKIFVLLKRAFGVRKSLLKTAMGMIDVDKADVRDVLECIVGSVKGGEAVEAVKRISEELLREDKREEVVVLGMNVLREIFTRNCKGYNSGCSSASGCSGGTGTSNSGDTRNNCSDDGLNNDLANDAIDEVDDPIGEVNNNHLTSLSLLKSEILKAIEPLKGNRTKSIFYAYKMIIRVVVEGKEVETEITEIKKKKHGKEERAEMRKKGREEIKRQRMEIRREEKHERYKNRRKGRKRTEMTKRLMRPSRK